MCVECCFCEMVVVVNYLPVIFYLFRKIKERYQWAWYRYTYSVPVDLIGTDRCSSAPVLSTYRYVRSHESNPELWRHSATKPTSNAMADHLSTSAISGTEAGILHATRPQIECSSPALTSDPLISAFLEPRPNTAATRPQIKCSSPAKEE